MSHNDDYRLAAPVKAYVYVKDADGKWVKSGNKVTLQEGDYVVAMPNAGAK